MTRQTPPGGLRCLLLVMCTHPFAKEALTLHLARSEGHERYFGCNLMHRNVLASSHQHLMAEVPTGRGSPGLRCLCHCGHRIRRSECVHETGSSPVTLQSSGASSPECNRNPELVPRPNISEPTPRCFHVEVAALRCDLELKSDRLLVYKIYVYKSPSPYS